MQCLSFVPQIDKLKKTRAITPFDSTHSFRAFTFVVVDIVVMVTYLIFFISSAHAFTR